MKNLSVFFGIGLLALSCTGPMHIPEAVQVSNLTEKNSGEFNFGAGLNGFELSGAYAITKNLGIQLQGAALATRSSVNSDFLNRYYAGGGIGFTSYLTADDDQWFYSVFAGGGLGQADSRQTINTLTFSNSTANSSIDINRSNGEYYKAWVQPTIGLINSGAAEIFFSTRFSYIKFNTLVNNFETNVDGLDLTDGSDLNIYYEPAITLRLGGDVVKWNLQMGYSFPHIPKSRSQFRTRQILFSTGMTFHFGY